MYVLDCWKAFRAFAKDEAGVELLDEKKLFEGLVWKDRIGVADFNADFEAAPSDEASLTCLCMMKDISYCCFQMRFNQIVVVVATNGKL
jgi:hypothetical protein